MLFMTGIECYLEPHNYPVRSFQPAHRGDGGVGLSSLWGGSRDSPTVTQPEGPTLTRKATFTPGPPPPHCTGETRDSGDPLLKLYASLSSPCSCLCVMTGMTCPPFGGRPVGWSVRLGNSGGSWDFGLSRGLPRGLSSMVASQ